MVAAVRVAMIFVVLSLLLLAVVIPGITTVVISLSLIVSVEGINDSSNNDIIISDRRNYLYC